VAKTIGLIADTHATSLRGLWEYLDPVFHGVDLIIHAGDIVTSEVLEELATYGPVHAVLGNNDRWDLNVPEHLVLEVEGVRIGVTHGTGTYRGITERVYAAFHPSSHPVADGEIGSGHRTGVDVIVHGHSHVPRVQTYEGVLIVNPGSATQARDPRGESVALLHIDQGRIEVEHRFFLEQR